MSKASFVTRRCAECGAEYTTYIIAGVPARWTCGDLCANAFRRRRVIEAARRAQP